MFNEILILYTLWGIGWPGGDRFTTPPRGRAPGIKSPHLAGLLIICNLMGLWACVRRGGRRGSKAPGGP